MQNGTKSTRKPMPDHLQLAPEKPSIDSLSWANGILDKYKGKSMDTFNKAVPKDYAQAMTHISTHARAYKAQMDNHLKKLQAKDPSKTELNEKDINEATEGKGAEAIEYTKAYTKGRNVTKLKETPLSTVKPSAPSFGDYDTKEKTTYSPDKGSSTLKTGTAKTLADEIAKRKFYTK